MPAYYSIYFSNPVKGKGLLFIFDKYPAQQHYLVHGYYHLALYLMNT